MLHHVLPGSVAETGTFSRPLFCSSRLSACSLRSVFLPFLPVSGLQSMCRALLPSCFWVSSAEVGRSRGGEVGLRPLCAAGIFLSGLAFALDPAPRAGLPLCLPSRSLAAPLFPPVRPALVYPPPASISLLWKYPGWLLPSGWALSQGWLDVLNSTKIFYLLFSNQLPPFTDYRTGLYFFHCVEVCGGIFWLFKCYCFVKRWGIFHQLSYAVIPSSVFYIISLQPLCLSNR